MPFCNIMQMNTYWKLLFLSKFVTENSLLPSGFIFQQDCAPANTADWLKPGFPPTAVNLLAKMNDHQIRRTLTLLIITE